MQTAPRPPNEDQRLATLHSLAILDTPPTEELDALTRLARRLFDVPISAISLVDEDRLWFKSITGLNLSEIPREISFCAHAICEEPPLVVPDTRADPRFWENPQVTGAPGIAAYAGHPVRSLEGHALGAVCLLDYKPHTFTRKELAQLKSIAEFVEVYFQKLEVGLRAQEMRRTLHMTDGELEQAFQHVAIGVCLVARDGRFLRVNPRLCELLGYREEELLQMTFVDITHPDDLAISQANLQALMAGTLQE